MPNNAVEYFVSYYDYYQPEAYVPQTDTFIEKDSSINAEVERLRHSTTNSLLSRRDVIVVSTRLVHLRPRHARGVPRRDDAAAGGAAGRSRLAHPQVRVDAVPAQRRRLLARHVPGARRHDRDHPDLRRAGDPHRDVRRRDRGALQPPSAHRPGGGQARRGPHLPRFALRREHRRDAAGDRHHPHRARGAARRARARGQAARGAAAPHAHHVRPRDDGADRILLRHRELLASHRRPGAGGGAALPARLLRRRLPRRDRRVARHRAADRVDVRGRLVAQAHARRARLPPAERARQPTAQVGRVQGPGRPDRLPVRDARPLRDGHRRRRGRADHPARPASSTPRSW